MKTALCTYLIFIFSSLPAMASGFSCLVFKDSSEKIKLAVDIQLDSDSKSIHYVRRGKLITDSNGNQMRDMLDERSYSFQVKGKSTRSELKLEFAANGDVGRWLDSSLEESEWLPISARTMGYIRVKGQDDKFLRGKAILPFVNNDRELVIRCEPFVERDHCGLFFCL